MWALGRGGAVLGLLGFAGGSGEICGVCVVWVGGTGNDDSVQGQE